MFIVYNNLNMVINRRANFTSADMRESDFSGSTFNGAYLEKAVAYKANFTGTLFVNVLSFEFQYPHNNMLSNHIIDEFLFANYKFHPRKRNKTLSLYNLNSIQ